MSTAKPPEQAAPAPTEASKRTMARADAPEVLVRVREGLEGVEMCAKQLQRDLGKTVMLDELVSFGREGLLSAARTFDPSRGVPFTRWASYRVRGAMIDGIRQTSMLPRSVYAKLRAVEAGHEAAEAALEAGSATRPASAEEADARLGTYLAGIATAIALGLLTAPTDPTTGDAPDPALAADEVIARGEMLGAVRDALAILPEPERHLIQRHYFDDVQLDLAAREIGLSKSWGSRLHGRAIEAITRHIKRSSRPR